MKKVFFCVFFAFFCPFSHFCLVLFNIITFLEEKEPSKKLVLANIIWFSPEKSKRTKKKTSRTGGYVTWLVHIRFWQHEMGFGYVQKSWFFLKLSFFYGSFESFHFSLFEPKCIKFATKFVSSLETSISEKMSNSAFML